jgi:hypothetical protein
MKKGNSFFDLSDGHWSGVPNELINCPYLAHSTFRLLAALASCGSTCFPGYKHISRTTGMSSDTVSRCIKEIVDRQIIRYERGGNKRKRSNRYSVRPRKDWILGPKSNPQRPEECGIGPSLIDQEGSLGVPNSNKTHTKKNDSASSSEVPDSFTASVGARADSWNLGSTPHTKTLETQDVTSALQAGAHLENSTSCNEPLGDRISSWSGPQCALDECSQVSTEMPFHSAIEILANDERLVGKYATARLRKFCQELQTLSALGDAPLAIESMLSEAINFRFGRLLSPEAFSKLARIVDSASAETLVNTYSKASEHRIHGHLASELLDGFEYVLGDRGMQAAANYVVEFEKQHGVNVPDFFVEDVLRDQLPNGSSMDCYGRKMEWRSALKTARWWGNR